MSAKRFPVMNAAGAAGPAVIEIYEEIGKDWWTDTGVGAADFAESLKQIPDTQDIVVAINSPGGNVWDGLAIYHQLQARKQRVTCRVDGVAASIASVIACAGSKTEMPENSLLMIHNPWCMAVGDSEELRKSADVLDKHREVIAGIYFDKTGMDPEQIYKLMDAETWMTGKEASAYGFCETTPAMLLAASASSHINRFRNAPKLGPATGTSNQPKDIPMPDNTPAPAPVATPAPAPADNSVILAALEKLSARLTAMENPPGAAAVSPGIQNLGNPIIEAHNRMKPGAERRQFLVENHDALVQARTQFIPKAANDFAAGLVNDYLTDALIVSWGAKLAMVDQFALKVSPNPMAPRASIDVPWATAGSSMLTNATNFEQGGTTLAVATVTMNQYTQPFSLANAELQQGHEIARIATINADNFGDGLHDLVTATMTTVAYGTATTIGAAASFSSSILPKVLALAKNYKRKILLLDGGHFAYLMPTNNTVASIASLASGGYGFDAILENNRWTGATTNTAGFVCGPDALVFAAALPKQAPSNVLIGQSTIQLKNGIAVQVYQWFSTSSRTLWVSYDIVFGVTQGNTGAAEVLTTS